MCPLPTATLSFLCCAGLVAFAAAQTAPPPASPNPYRLEPFHADFPVPLEYPPSHNREYEGTRRQMLQRLAANLQGNVSRGAWELATEFFWRAPKDAIEPLIDAMDRSMGNPALGDVVKNCAEAMGKMGDSAFEPVLRRALQHKNEAVRQAAYAALAACGSAATLLELRRDFVLMDGRARAAWLRAVRMRLPEQRIEILQDLMMAQLPSAVRDQVLKETLQLPLAGAATVLRGRWPDAVEEFKALIAGVLHAAEDATGTVWLHEALRGEDLPRMLLAIQHCTIGGAEHLGPLREDLLRTTTHQRPEVRLTAAKTLVGVDGDDVADVYEVLSASGEVWEVRAIALRELTRRGRDRAVTLLLEELPSSAGTRLQQVLNELSVSGDPRAVPVLVERFAKAPAGEGRPFLQALSQNGSAVAAEALCDLFVGPERLVSRSAASGELTTRSYLPTLLLNLRGHERLVLARFCALPPADWSLRARLMPTLAGIAADRRDPELAAALIAPLRELLFARDELPQLRVLALNQLARNWLTIEDALRLKNQRHDEQPGLRALFGEFLVEYF